MRIPRILIAAPGSGSGKTMMTCGIMQCLKNEKKVQAFKCGPDYIDPMFHETVLGISSENLDTFFLQEDEMTSLVANVCEANGAEISVIEGVMGLYDGIGGGKLEGSAYHIASVLKTPIILVVDAHGMADSILALLAGFLQFDENHLIQGVILNRMSAGYYSIMKPLIEERLSLPVLGFCPVLKEGMVESRHLGLKMPHEVEDVQARMQHLEDTLKETIDLERLIQIAESAPEIIAIKENGTQSDVEAKLSLAVAMDEAFCFYYKENLRMFEGQGVRIVPFSPLHDEKLPEGISGMLLGGGYPELYAKCLSQNQSMRQSIYDAIKEGIPALAECGGFMYLHEAMCGEDGGTYPMVGIIQGNVKNQGRLVRFGYATFEGKKETDALLVENERIRGHEFHYYDSTHNGTDCMAVKSLGKATWECMHMTDHQCFGFPHLYYGSNPEFLRRFVRSMEQYKAVEKACKNM